MVSDSSLGELHGFARRLGLRRERFQEHGRLPHYDLRPETRKKAIALGAEVVGFKELCRRERDRYPTAGEVTPLVLLHGVGTSSGEWSWVLPDLARKHLVYVVDLPG